MWFPRKRNSLYWLTVLYWEENESVNEIDRDSHGTPHALLTWPARSFREVQTGGVLTLLSGSAHHTDSERTETPDPWVQGARGGACSVRAGLAKIETCRTQPGLVIRESTLCSPASFEMQILRSKWFFMCRDLLCWDCGIDLHSASDLWQSLRHKNTCLKECMKYKNILSQGHRLLVFFKICFFL